ncbi:hypothetical protein LSAT2_001656 [Lamellibrachia satsuma]|nr:hypothetical protein LSAT2_001656 [Lamellibrachia satsuma]
MNKKIDDLTASIKLRDAGINELEQQVNSLETDLDSLEQYPRRTNLQFQVIPDTANGDDIEAKTMDIVNNPIGLTPPLETNEIVRCHRMGRTPNKRSILVKFHSELRREAIIRMRRKLKGNTCRVPRQNSAGKGQNYGYLDLQW